MRSGNFLTGDSLMPFIAVLRASTDIKAALAQRQQARIISRNHSSSSITKIFFMRVRPVAIHNLSIYGHKTSYFDGKRLL